jgi:hypothetical protein
MVEDTVPRSITFVFLRFERHGSRHDRIEAAVRTTARAERAISRLRLVRPDAFRARLPTGDTAREAVGRPRRSPGSRRP